MTGFESKRQASKDLLEQALDALLCCSPDSEVGAALQIKTVKDLRAALAEPAYKGRESRPEVLANAVADEQSYDTGLWFVATTVSEAYLQAALRRLSAAVEGTHPDPWRDAIDAQLFCLHLGTVESFPTAKAALDALINWHVATALDPEVSSSAKLLVDRGAAVAERLREALVMCSTAGDGLTLAQEAQIRAALKGKP